MNIHNLILAAQIRLKESIPDLETDAIVKLNPIEAQALRYMINQLVGPALMQQFAEEKDEAEKQRLGTLLESALAIANRIDDAIDVVLADLRAAKQRLAEADRKAA